MDRDIERELELETRDDGRRRLAVATSSYGLSALIHLGLLLVFMFLFGAQRPHPRETATVLPKFEHKEQDYDPTAKRALHTRPQIQHEQIIEKPIRELEEEVDPTEKPKGTDANAQANKNLSATAAVDAIGTAGGASGAIGNRFDKGSLSRIGGGEKEIKAVLSALWWLQRHQDADGKWSCAQFHKNCRAQSCSGPDCRSASGKGAGAGEGLFDVGVTALGLLAFLGNGDTHRFSRIPEFKAAVKHGLSYLLRIQAPDGSLGYVAGADGEQTIYNHAIATMALCDAYLSANRDFTLKKPAREAVAWLVRAQNPQLGWKYEPVSGKNDTSVTGWVVLALKSARMAGFDVPEQTFAGALTWLDRATSDGGPGKPPGLVGYQRAGDGGSALNRRLLAAQLGHKLAHMPRFVAAPTMTAVGVLTRVLAGQKRSDQRVKEGIKILMAKLPHWSTATTKNATNFYYWYYGTYGIFQATELNSRAWQRWNRAMQQALIGDGTNRQRMGRVCEDGSWDPVGEWCVAGGRVYATAINALTLEVYYRFEHAMEGTGVSGEGRAK